jgi:hypothetical protein
MAVSVEYAVEEAMDLSQRLESWEIVIRFHAQAREFYLLQSVQICSMAHSAASQAVQEDHSVAVKRPGHDAVVYGPVWETENKTIPHIVEYNISSSGENDNDWRIRDSI